MLVNKKTIAELLDVDERTVSRWQKSNDNPLPIGAKGKRGTSNSYDVRECFLWWHRREIIQMDPGHNGQVYDFEIERARLTKETADTQEMKNEVTRRELAPVDFLTWALNKIAAQICPLLETIPPNMKKRIPHLKASEIKIAENEIAKMRNIISGIKLDIDEYFETGD